MEDLLSWKKELKFLISKNKFIDAFEIIKNDLSKDSTSFNEIILKESDFSKVETDKRNSLISYDEEIRQYNRIRFSLFMIIDSITHMNFKSHPELLEQVPEEESEVFGMLINKIEHLEKGIHDTSEILHNLKVSTENISLKIEQLDGDILDTSETLKDLKVSNENYRSTKDKLQKRNSLMGCSYVLLVLIAISYLILFQLETHQRNRQLFDKVDKLNYQLGTFNKIIQDEEKNESLDSLIQLENTRIKGSDK